MTQEQKELLLKDLCARLPYKVKCLVSFDNGDKHIMTLKTGLPNSFGRWDFYNDNCSGCSNNFKPYLRSMSSMTEEEKENLQSLHDIISDENYGDGYSPSAWDAITEWEDYCNSRYLDYRGLIPMGLALPAKEGMYNLK